MIIQMQAPNPYSTNTPDHSIEAETDIDKRHRLITAFSIGLSSCLIGPIFLWLFWIAHGLARGIIQTLSFFALIYVVPSLIAVVIGLLAGFVLSPMCPRIDGTKRWAITIGVAVVTNAIGIGL
ncbi:MAG: hypothetical protein KDB00_00195, partial [Planctomycetales bacterium]|nr:hypothetical protein [Planctomycetales bacterium]